jgi:hypothetical protein
MSDLGLRPFVRKNTLVPGQASHNNARDRHRQTVNCGRSQFANRPQWVFLLTTLLDHRLRIAILREVADCSLPEVTTPDVCFTQRADMPRRYGTPQE